ncbi:MAG: ATP-binding protein [Rhodospirillales bacterium]|nr:ATP-binding protein [Rhodospirillales bacterium]
MIGEGQGLNTLHQRGVAGSAERPTPAEAEDARSQVLASSLRPLTGRRGRLTIFLGAAPGVGKTHSMLKSALAKREAGVDVVIGLVDSHGRTETGVLALELDAVPLRVVEQEGRLYRELNVGAILARRPQLVLVDDLHRPRIGGRGDSRRYHDVEVLLAAGIDVFGTLNLQHLEGAADQIAELTGYRDRLIVPDRLLDEADAIEVVDLAPDELIRRFRAGQVWLPPQMRRVSGIFYARPTVTALRTLAFRHAGRRDEPSGAPAARGARNWVGRRIVVGIAADDSTEPLIHAVNRIAIRNNAAWLAVHVDAGRDRRSVEQQERLEAALALARELGGETAVVSGRSVAEELIRIARSHGAQQIIVGRSHRSTLSLLIRSATAQALVETGEGIEVSVVQTPRRRLRPGSLADLIQPRAPAVRNYLMATAAVAVAAVVARFALENLGAANLMLLLLAPVLISAVRFGFGPAALAAAEAVVAYNFFFAWPQFSLKAASSFQDAVTFAMFLLAAGLTSHLAGRARDREIAASDRGRIAEALLRFSRDIAAAVRPGEVMQVIVAKVDEILDAQSVFLLPHQTEERLEAIIPEGETAEGRDREAAQWCVAHEQPAGRGTGRFAEAERQYLPIATGEGVLGVLGIRYNDPAAADSESVALVTDGMVRQAAIALERARLSERMQDARFFSQSESLRAALLSSISHDLRTPLASIMGAASSLLRFGKGFDEGTRHDLVQTIHEEADRLNRFVGNLLDMTKLEAGALTPQLKWEDLTDLIGAAIASQRSRIPGDRFKVDLEPGLPMLAIDFVLMEQVLINLIDNAHKNSDPAMPIAIRALRSSQEVELSVRDEGAGIAEAELGRIFEKFYRVGAKDRKVAGTGLGLAICKGIVEAHGGTISAASEGLGCGSVFTIRLPIASEAPTLTPEEAVDAR